MIKTGKSNTKYFFVIIIPILLFLVFFTIFQSYKPIRIGYIGFLSGPQSDSGILVLNGVELAVSEMNKAGGIKGRKIELHFRDAFQYMDDLSLAIDELLKEDVKALIGPDLSVLAVKLVPIINSKKILLISPWVSTDLLSRKDDYFLRVMMADKRIAGLFSSYIYKEKGWRNITAVFDLSNRAYTEEFCLAIKEEFEKLGGSLNFIEPYSTGKGISGVVENLLKNPSEVVLIAGTAEDTARICQDLKKKDSNQNFIANDWAMHEKLIFSGGLAVENLIIPTQYFENSGKDEFIRYSENYKARFDRNPSNPDTFGYDAANVLFKAFETSRKWDVENLKKTILKINEYSGPMGVFRIDEFGDAERQVKIVTIRNGDFIRLK